MRKVLLSAAALAVFAALLIAAQNYSGTQVKQKKDAPAGEFSAVKQAEPAGEPAALAGEGKKHLLPDGSWFTWKFDKKPQLGTAIMKVRIYSASGVQETACEVFGEAGMPSMPYHDTGPIKFQLNKKGDYLLPVDVVMAGEWAVVIRIKRSGKEIFSGKVIFNV